MDSIIRISRNAMDSALEAAKNTYPNEFLGLLRERNGVLSELLLAPLQVANEESVYFPIYAVPTDPSIVATFHSHPSRGSARPSKADRNLFSRHYRCHFISSLPYTAESTNAFDNDGEKISFEVID